MQTATEQRRAFAIWLRTGRRPIIGDEDAIEVKFNPWHDPSDGRFTSAGQGQTSAGGGRTNLKRPRARRVYKTDDRLPAVTSLADAKAWRESELKKHPDDPDWRDAIEARYQFYLKKLQPDSSERPLPPVFEAGGSVEGGGGGGATGSWDLTLLWDAEGARTDDHDLRFGGGGATGTWDVTPTDGDNAVIGGGGKNAPDLPQAGAHTARQEASWRHISRNGYDYAIDEHGRTRRVSGELQLTPAQPRSRTLQRGAGGVDRLPKDDGGHYIAPRFNGPAEAFNHFAQDANVNRGRYRALEDQWAREKRAGHKVTVKIAPHFRDGSQRPSSLSVRFEIDGRRQSIELPNEKSGGRRGH